MNKDDSVTTPVLLAIHICDFIIRDEVTKKISLIGLFNRIQAKSFPAVHPFLNVYVSLTNGHKIYNGELRFVNDKTDKVILNAKCKVIFKNPLHNVELNFAIRNVKFSEPGDYTVEFYCDDKLVGSRKFLVAGSSTGSKQTND